MVLSLLLERVLYRHQEHKQVVLSSTLERSGFRYVARE